MKNLTWQQHDRVQTESQKCKLWTAVSTWLRLASRQPRSPGLSSSRPLERETREAGRGETLGTRLVSRVYQTSDYAAQNRTTSTRTVSCLWIVITTSTEIHRQLTVLVLVVLFYAAYTPLTRPKQLSRVCIFGFQFGLCHVVVTSSFSFLRSLSLAVIVFAFPSPLALPCHARQLKRETAGDESDTHKAFLSHHSVILWRLHREVVLIIILWPPSVNRHSQWKYGI